MIHFSSESEGIRRDQSKPEVHAETRGLEDQLGAGGCGLRHKGVEWLEEKSDIAQDY
jgi:hypothetical protein